MLDFLGKALAIVLFFVIVGGGIFGLLTLIEEDSVTWDCGAATLRIEGDEAGELGLREDDLRRFCVRSLERRGLVR